MLARLLWRSLGLLALWPATADAFDHSHAYLDEVLSRHVEDGLVDYAALVEEYADSTSAFSQYLEQLAGVAAAPESTWTHEQRLAYWINAYNAFTLELIVKDYPIDAAWYMWVFPFVRLFVPANSILMIGGRWDDKTFDSIRGPITLGAIEHEILRPELGDPRIHFAIVCASLSCPDLRSAAYHPEFLDEELDAAARAFMTSEEHVRIEPDGGLEVSKIFDWFREDFERPPPGGREVSSLDVSSYGKDAGVARWVAAYGAREAYEAVAAGSGALGHLGYDWELNELRRGP